MLFKNVLVPYDLSNPSYRAFKVALDVAKKYSSSITIVTCIEGDPWHHKFYDSRADTELLKKQKKAASDHISKLEELAKKSNTPFKARIIRAESVVKELVRFAKSHKFDLIVMGSHGRTGLDKLILGSVANGVTQRVRCPVLLVKA